jgi:putative transposase
MPPKPKGGVKKVLLRAHKIALDPTNLQATYFAKACGVARKAYNWGLDNWQIQYQAKKLDPTLSRPSQASLRRLLNRIKEAEFPYMLEVTKCAPQQALIDLGTAFDRFFQKKAKYPKFHKKGVNDSFYISNDQFRIEGKKIRVPNLGWVRMTEELRYPDAKILSATISRTAGRWFVSIAVEIAKPLEIENPEGGDATTDRVKASTGIDLGLTHLVVLANGEKTVGEKPYKKLIKKQRLLARALSRKKGGSKNREKAKRKLARHHAKVANIRRNALHQLTNQITNRFTLIGIETLNIAGMVKNHNLAQAILDQGFHEFKRQLLYKSSAKGGIVVLADRWFASTKICFDCKFIVDTLDLGIRIWTCPSCGVVHDRDINAAKNLEAMAIANMAVSSTVTACGEDSSGTLTLLGTKLASQPLVLQGKKQELNSKSMVYRNV